MNTEYGSWNREFCEAKHFATLGGADQGQRYNGNLNTYCTDTHHRTWCTVQMNDTVHQCHSLHQSEGTLVSMAAPSCALSLCDGFSGSLPSATQREGGLVLCHNSPQLELEGLWQWTKVRFVYYIYMWRSRGVQTRNKYEVEHGGAISRHMWGSMMCKMPCGMQSFSVR